MKLRVGLTLPILLILASLPVHAQEIISATTIAQLQSAVRLDFDAVAAQGLVPASGVFAMNPDASVIVSFANVAGESPLSTAVIWDGHTGEIEQTLFIGENQYDRRLVESGLLVGRGDGARLFDLQTGEAQQVLQSPGSPLLLVWEYAAGIYCGETAPDLRGEAFVLCSDERAPVPVPGGDFVRIGRVPPPLMITVNEDGQVNRWNLQNELLTGQANAGDVAVFGAVNIDGSVLAAGSASHLAWRNPLSTSINLLDFATGENRQLAELDGSFIAYILLSRHADVIFALDPMSSRGAIWAWDAEKGEQFDLGTYRECSRQPDLARMSDDGSALVIGCDTGIDVWRLSQT